MKICVIGAAGSIGAPTAFCIGERKLAETIAMIDLPGDNLNSHVSDLSTGLSSADIEVVSGGLELLEDASLVVMAASVPTNRKSSNHELLRSNLALIAEVACSIKRYCPEAILIQVTNPIESLAYAAYQVAGMKREKIIGYTINDSFRFQMLMAKCLNTEPSRVEAIVIGEHGLTQVPVFSNVKVDGHSVEILDEVKQQAVSRIPEIFKELAYYRKNTGRTAGWTTAIGIADLVQAVVTDSKKILPCSTILKGEYGMIDICLGVPAVIGKSGVERIIELMLSPEEELSLEVSAKVVRKATANVMEMLQEKK
jgi:malate dehydrogenase